MQNCVKPASLWCFHQIDISEVYRICFFHLFPWKKFRKCAHLTIRKPGKHFSRKLPRCLCETALLRAFYKLIYFKQLQYKHNVLKDMSLFSLLLSSRHKKHDKLLAHSPPEAKVYLYRIINHGGQRIVSILEAILCCYSGKSWLHRSNRFNNSSEDAQMLLIEMNTVLFGGHGESGYSCTWISLYDLKMA